MFFALCYYYKISPKKEITYNMCLPMALNSVFLSNSLFNLYPFLFLIAINTCSLLSKSHINRTLPTYIHTYTHTQTHHAPTRYSYINCGTKVGQVDFVPISSFIRCLDCLPGHGSGGGYALI